MTKLLLVDCFDSFSYNLRDYLQQAGAEVEVCSTAQAPPSKPRAEYQGLVLSPGPGHPKEMPHLMDYLKWAEGHLPCLGICLGAQAMAVYTGAQLVHGRKPMHGKKTRVWLKNTSELVKGLPEHFEVIRYHSLVVDTLPTDFQLLITGEYGEIMGFVNEVKGWYGIQYHPEAWETQHGKKLLSNWIEMLSS